MRTAFVERSLLYRQSAIEDHRRDLLRVSRRRELLAAEDSIWLFERHPSPSAYGAKPAARRRGAAELTGCIDDPLGHFARRRLRPRIFRSRGRFLLMSASRRRGQRRNSFAVLPSSSQSSRQRFLFIGTLHCITRSLLPKLRL